MLNVTSLRRMKVHCYGCFPFSVSAEGIYLKYTATCGILRTWEYSVEQCCRVIIALHFSSHFLVFWSSVVIWYGRIPILRKWCAWVVIKLSYRNLCLRWISNHGLWMSSQQTQHLQPQCAALLTLELLTCAWKYHNLERELSSVAEF